MDASTSNWLSAPVTTLFSDRSGRTRAAYVRFRTGKTVRVEQPDPEYPVFLYVGDDDLPVGIKFTAPISFEVQSRIRYFLRSDQPGDPPLVSRSVTHSFRPILPTLVEPTLRQVEQASRTLEGAPA